MKQQNQGYLPADALLYELVPNSIPILQIKNLSPTDVK